MKVETKPTGKLLATAKEIMRIAGAAYVKATGEKYEWEWDKITEANRAACLAIARWHFEEKAK